MPARSRCPVACALDLLGDRWTLVVLRDVLMFGRYRFNEMLDNLAQHEEELRNQRDELEQRIRNKTSELLEEIDERGDGIHVGTVVALHGCRIVRHGAFLLSAGLRPGLVLLTPGAMLAGRITLLPS